MSSRLIRVGLLAILGITLAGVIAWAQDRKPTESAGPRTTPVFNPVEGRMVVSSARPDGSRVEAGDVVCEFDPAELRERLASQGLVVQGAQAEVHATRIAREVAVMALHEFKEGAYAQQLATTDGQIKLAESKLSRALDRADWAHRMFLKGYASLAEKVSEDLALKQARFALEATQSQKKVLIDHSRERETKALTGAIESARARELAAQAALAREQSSQKKLADQLLRCQVKAPAAGKVEYAAPFGAGAVVHDGQLLFRIVTDAAAGAKLE
jgi:multidrug resistance efflux pump